MSGKLSIDQRLQLGGFERLKRDFLAIQKNCGVPWTPNPWARLPSRKMRRSTISLELSRLNCSRSRPIFGGIPFEDRTHIESLCHLSGVHKSYRAFPEFSLQTSSFGSACGREGVYVIRTSGNSRKINRSFAGPLLACHRFQNRM